MKKNFQRIRGAHFLGALFFGASLILVSYPLRIYLVSLFHAGAGTIDRVFDPLVLLIIVALSAFAYTKKKYAIIFGFIASYPVAYLILALIVMSNCTNGCF